MVKIGEKISRISKNALAEQTSKLLQKLVILDCCFKRSILGDGKVHACMTRLSYC